jgi:hypothetical protein
MGHFTRVSQAISFVNEGTEAVGDVSGEVRQPGCRTWRRFGEQIAVPIHTRDFGCRFNGPFHGIGHMKFMAAERVNPPGLARALEIAQKQNGSQFTFAKPAIIV